MGKVIKYEQIPALIKKLKIADKKIVLVGGCFDILHKGHLEFLKRSKEQGDFLVIMVEGDKKVTELKGKGRPVNSQDDRAAILSHLSGVDYVIPIPYFKENKDYESLVKSIQPDIIATTAGDPILGLKKRYAKMVGGEAVEVIERKKGYSSSKYANKIK